MTKSKNKNGKEKSSRFVSYGQFQLPSIQLNSEAKELCRLLNNFYKTYPFQHKRQKASDLLMGAFYAIRPECRSNPDWRSQSANSARDILYPLLRQKNTGADNLIELFKELAIKSKTKIVNTKFVSVFSELDILYRKLSDLTHHGIDPRGFASRQQYSAFSDREYSDLLDEYCLVLKQALSYQQFYIHSSIDNILMSVKNLASTKKTLKIKNQLTLILKTNEDAKQYFFGKANENWLKWLWKNGFLEAIKEKTSDSNSYSFRMPELNYLVNMAEKKPDKVTEIICSFEILSSNFNPEVIDQFVRISGKFPARCLQKIVKKIRGENWIELMGKYTQYGFDYADMLKTLHKEDDHQSILILSEAILQIRNKDELKERKTAYGRDNFFYISDISETKVFTYLAEMPEEYLEKSLSIMIDTFAEAIEDRGDYFFMDEDFFTLRLRAVVGDSYLEEFKFLTATVIEIVRKLFTVEELDKKVIYQKYFDKLPKNQVTRRLKLFVLSLQPKLFIEELKAEYFNIFETKKIRQALYGAEYERALKAGFTFLTNIQKRGYVAKAFNLFGNSKDEDDKEWKKHYASCILSTISEDLTREELDLAKENDFKIDSKYQPEPSIGKVISGTVTPRSPLSADDFASFTIQEIAEKLKSDLSPAELQKKYKSDNFLKPIDADGVAEQLKNDIKNRIADYLQNATLFFDREKLVPHYTNSYLRGIQDTLSENRSNLDKLNYNNLFELFLLIQESGEKESLSKIGEDSKGRWLSSWDSVHSTIADLTEELIKQKDKSSIVDFKQYRARIFEILKYLFSFEDPIQEDEKLETAKSTIKNPNEQEYSISDPFTIAINSVRGRAFQTLLHFISRDVGSNEKIKIADDVKDLYVGVLKKENTRAIIFMFGHYLPTFYFRDMKWTRSIFKEIFESKSKDEYLHLAAWEGYLSNNLYSEVFFEPYIQGLYRKNITLNLSYPKQKFFKDPHESLAIHFALAFVHFEEFGLNNELFEEFLKKADEKQLAEFISFLGKSLVTKENYGVLKDEKFPWRITRVKDFWELMLVKKNKSSSLKEFGDWMEVSSGAFEIQWLAHMIAETLNATGGELEWDYGLTKSIEKLAAEAPRDTLAILEKHLMWLIGNKEYFLPIRDDKEWCSAFKILYENTDKKISADTYSLINELIEKGGKQFWSLEDIVKEK